MIRGNYILYKTISITVSLHCREGYGVLTWAAGNRYEGNWRASKTNGHGKHTFANGDVLEGERKDDKAHGHCQMTWFTSNFVYDGKWTAGEPNGMKIFTLLVICQIKRGVFTQPLGKA